MREGSPEAVAQWMAGSSLAKATKGFARVDWGWFAPTEALNQQMRSNARARDRKVG